MPQYVPYQPRHSSSFVQYTILFFYEMTNAYEAHLSLVRIKLESDWDDRDIALKKVLDENKACWIKV